MRHDDDETWKLETELRQDTQVSRLSQDRDMKMKNHVSRQDTCLKTGDWNLQDWKMTHEVAGLEIVGLDSDRVEFGGLEID